MNISEIRNKVERLKGQRKQVKEQISRLIASVDSLTTSLHRHEEARELLQEIGLRTQEQLQYHISDITSLALSAVFDDPYELRVVFEKRRNKTECDLLFVRNDKEVEPLEASGYGAVDVAALSLRVASWTMMNPRSRNTIILDEPMRFLSEDRQPYASQMLKELSERLGIQFIIVTHEQELVQYADKVFEVSIRNGKSIITTGNG
jgi:DNA repair exonuclease SbcCD ATPase subunit